jgi:porin
LPDTFPAGARTSGRIVIDSARSNVRKRVSVASVGPFALSCLIVCGPIVLSPARAGDAGGTYTAQPSGQLSLGQSSSGQTSSNPPSLPVYLHQLTDIGGLRTQLEKQGLTFTFSYFGDTFENPLGGVKQGPGYDGRFGIIMDGDLEKLVGWSGGKVHASVHTIFGSLYSTTNLDNLMLVSNIEATPTVRLFNLWFEQNLTSKISLKLGQFTAAQEFIVSKNADLFMNSTFGWPMLNTQDLPSGGPNYPEAGLGARLQVTFNDQFLMRAAIFDGDPAGSGSNNPISTDKYGVAFRVNDPPFMIVEAVFGYGGARLIGAQQNPNQEGNGLPAADEEGPRLATKPTDLPGVIKVGAWYNAGTFPLQDFTQSGVMPPQVRGDAAVYGVFEQTLWRMPGSPNRALGFVARGVAAPSDRSEFDRYVDTGLTFRGPFAWRPDDVVGLAFAYGHISPAAAADDRALAAQLGVPIPIRDYEAAIEFTYRYEIAEDWAIQPDIQYIFHPGSNIANPANLTSLAPIPNALVVGVRTALEF